MEENDNKVVSIFSKKEDKKETKVQEKEEITVDEIFKEIQEKNKKSKEKRIEEMLKNNKKVLRTYRIKD